MYVVSVCCNHNLLIGASGLAHIRAGGIFNHYNHLDVRLILALSSIIGTGVAFSCLLNISASSITIYTKKICENNNDAAYIDIYADRFIYIYKLYIYAYV